MRLTVNLEPDLYALAKSLAKAEDCSISVAVNRLLRKALPGQGGPEKQAGRKPVMRNGFRVSRGVVPITPEMVQKAESEDDEA